MQVTYQQALAHFGPEQRLQDACSIATFLATVIRGIQRRDMPRDALAMAVAEMEIRCEQLRLIAGSELVDLHKVESLAHLQMALRRVPMNALEEQPLKKD